MGYQFFSNPYAAEEEGIQQRLRYAQALQQQSLTPDQGQMVSGHYVPTSWTQGLAKLGGAAMGGKAYADALKTTKTVAGKRQQALIQALQGYATSKDPNALLANPDTAPAGMEAIVRQQEYAQRAALRPPTVANVREGNEQVSKQYDPATGQWIELGRGAAFAPNSNLTFEQRKTLAELRAGSGATPSNIREWQIFQAMSPEDQNRYLTMKRGLDWQNRGDALVAPDPLDPAGDPSAVIPKELPPEQLPETKHDQAAAAAQGKIEGESTATAKVELPGTLAGADQTLGLIDKLLAHPGLPSAVGMKGAAMGYGVFKEPVAGTQAADFMAIKDQLGGKQFLEAFESLKGGGQITEVEGKKATDAIAAMQTSQSEAAFKAAAKEFRDVVEAAKKRAISKAGGAAPVAPVVEAPGTSIDDILNKYPE